MLTRWDLEELYHEEDNELMHYGVKGMHWGKHLPGVDILNAAIAKARAGATNLRNELNGTNAYNKGIAEAKRRNKNLDATIAQTRAEKTISTSQQLNKQARIKEYQNSQKQNIAEATSTNAKRAAYENSVVGKLKKFANNTLKGLKYNVSKTTKSLSKSLSKNANKTLSSLKKNVSEFASGTKSRNPIKGNFTGSDAFRTGYKAKKTANKAIKTVRKAATTVGKKAKSTRNYGSGVTGNSIVKSLTNSSYRKGNLVKRNAMDRIQNVANRVGYRTKKQKKVSRANSAINRYYSGR